MTSVMPFLPFLTCVLLYFGLSGQERYLRYRKYGISAILIYVVIEMGIPDFLKIPVLVSLAFYLCITFAGDPCLLIFKKGGRETETFEGNKK